MDVQERLAAATIGPADDVGLPVEMTGSQLVDLHRSDDCTVTSMLRPHDGQDVAVWAQRASAQLWRGHWSPPSGLRGSHLVLVDGMPDVTER